MSEYLMINPNLLYKLYSHKDVHEYYQYSFLPDYNSIEIDIFYDILNSLSLKQLQNIDSYIYKQWELTKLLLKKDIIDNHELLSVVYDNKNINSPNSFNEKLFLFINHDQIMGLYIMNKLSQFLYPC